MNIRLAKSETEALVWERFVTQHVACSNYHRWGWKQVIEKSFHWPTFYLMAEEGEQVRGILPLVWQKSRMFGSFVTSLPFLNCGGVVAESKSAKDALVSEAVTLTKRAGADYLELRHRSDPELDLRCKTHKVAMVMTVGPKEEAMWAALPHKVRTDIRKSMKAGLEAEFGGPELLATFYEIFAQNMRDLGTPVYRKGLFSEIFGVFPGDSHICIVRYKDRAIATSFLSGYRDTIEALWSSSLYECAPLKPNMFLYWRALCFAGERGYQVFDFGRSSVGSGTHRFKKQWGSQEIPLHWSYWVPDGGALPEVNNENPRYRFAIRVWQKLPVSVTKMIGPPIVRCLP
jgi:FemAB-related protein (PEP-CTERM system-associated)